MKTREGAVKRRQALVKSVLAEPVVLRSAEPDRKVWVSISPDELNIKARKLDTLFWSDVLARNKAVRGVLKYRPEKLAGGDLFMSLFADKPVVKSSDVAPDPAMAEWLRQAAETAAFVSLREITVGDRALAAAGSVRLFRELMRERSSTFKAILMMQGNKQQAEAVIPDAAVAKLAGDTIRRAQQAMATGMNVAADMAKAEATTPTLALTISVS